MATQKTAKQVTVLNVYKFNHIARICFIVESSNGKDTYNTCFNGDSNHGSCTCPALRGCYHLDQLRPRATAYFDSRKPMLRAASGEISEQKMNEMAAYYEKEAALAPLHNANSGQHEERGGRLVPMR